MLSVSALNLSYTAYRTGDQVKLANWKYSGLDDAIKNYDKGKLLVTDTNKVVKDIIQAAASSNGIYNQLKNNLIVSGSTNRPDNDSIKTFSLNFKFSEVGDGVKTANLVSSNFKATSIGQGSVSIRGVSQPKHISIGNTKLTLFNKMGILYEPYRTGIMYREQ